MAGNLLAQGYLLDSCALQPFSCASGRMPLCDLPSYPWNRSRKYWVESRISRDYRFRKHARGDILGAPFHDWNPIEPRWRNFIRLQEQPWIRGHIVQGSVAYPAAGFACMALEAAAQMNALATSNKIRTDDKIILKDVSISRALVVPDTEEGVEVVLSMRPLPISSRLSSSSWSEFRIFSYTPASGWSEHCRGIVSTAIETTKSLTLLERDCKASLQEAALTCSSSADPKKLYEALSAVGLQYGDCFRGISEISMGPGTCLGKVQIADTRETMPHHQESDHLLHPTTLDNLFQMSITALCDGDLGNVTQPFVPTFIKSVSLHRAGEVAAGSSFYVAATGERKSTRKAVANISAHATEDMGYSIQIKGLECIALSTQDSSKADSVPKLGARATWQPDVSLIAGKDLASLLKACASEDEPRIKDSEFMSWYYIDRALHAVNETDHQNMPPHHQKFFRFLQRQQALVQTGAHEQQTPEWTSLDEPEVQAKIARLRQAFLDPAKNDMDGQMTVRIGEALPAIFKQQVDGLGLMLEGGLLYEYYTNSLGTHLTYPQVARYIGFLAHKNPNLSYLEIGAGTGGMSRNVLRALRSHDPEGPARMKSYTYTDISTGFFPEAQKKLAEWERSMIFKRLDIEQDPESQGLSPGQYDVILAANVLHATYDIHETLSNVRKLLAPGGQLVLLEMTHPLLSSSMPFGTLSGWWNCKESWRPDGPLLDESRWRNSLKDAGFEDLLVSTPDREDPLNECSRLMVATVSAETASNQITRSSNGNVVLIMAEAQASTDGLGSELASSLGSNGFTVELETIETIAKKDLKGSMCISLLGYEGADFTGTSEASFATLKHITAESSGLIWLTKGAAEGTNSNGSIFSGIARSLRTEQQDLPCTTMDFSAKSPCTAGKVSQLVLRVFSQFFLNGPSAKPIDCEFAEKDGLLYIKRVIEDSTFSGYIASRTKGQQLKAIPGSLAQDGRALKLTAQSATSKSRHVWAEDSALIKGEIRDQEVEIRIHTFGLPEKRDASTDFTDALQGHACAGVVTAVGAACSHLSPDDRVIAWNLPGTLATRVRCAASCIRRIPDWMSFAMGASIPKAYVPAYAALVRTGRLAAGETVLIQAASTEIAQAGFRIAESIGAMVFAIVDDEAAKVALVEAGLSVDCVLFAGQERSAETVRQKIPGHSVDVALLQGGNDTDSLSLASLVAPFGRIVQLKDPEDNEVDATTNRTTPTANVSVMTMDFAALGHRHPDAVNRMVGEVLEMIDAGQLAQPRTRIEAMSSIASLEKNNSWPAMVLEVQPEDRVPIVPAMPDPITFRADATYILAGGLGGLGRSISRWMLRQGARNILFLSRSGASSKEAQDLIAELQDKGARAVALSCDISNGLQLRQVLAEQAKCMPEIRGILQAAMVLKDSLFVNMTHDAWMTALKPKVAGSWNLHEATLDSPLEFFVMLSSLAGLTGTAGQSNYVSGCNYQVALAAHRQALGLPAASIDVGYVSSLGFIAENTTTAIEQNLANIGMGDVQEIELHAMLECAMQPRLYEAPQGHFITGLYPSRRVGEDEFPFFARDPVFSHLEFLRPYLYDDPQDGTDDGDHVTRKPLHVQLKGVTSSAEIQDIVLNALRAKAARLLMMAYEDLNPAVSLRTYGVDSLVAIEIRNWLLREAKADASIFEILHADPKTLAEAVVAKSALTQVAK